MKIGLVGPARSDPPSDRTRALWLARPFCRWLVTHHACQVDNVVMPSPDGRQVYILGGCRKMTNSFLAGLDAVVAVGPTEPPELFYNAKENFGVATVLDVGPDDPILTNAYWYRYADRVVAATPEIAAALAAGRRPAAAVAGDAWAWAEDAARARGG